VYSPCNFGKLHVAKKIIGEYTMNVKDNNVVGLANLDADLIKDSLTEFLREGAVKLLKSALENEVNNLLQQYQNETTDSGKQRLVRNGYLPERNIQTGIGSVAVSVPRVRDRAYKNTAVKFESELIPKYMRRTATLDVMLPLLYLKGISTNEFGNILQPMLGTNAKAISPSVISSLKASWYQEFNSWQLRDLSSKRYVYFWTDGVYLKVRSEADKTCMLVIVGVDEHGNKELVALYDGYRESKSCWKSLLLDLKSRGLNYAPHLAIGDGALGFWGALTEVYPTTKHQRCWVHKTANILEKLPKSMQGQAKSILHNIYLAPTKADAVKTFDKFIKNYEAKYPKATTCLIKDKRELMAFYDFPARHWQHIRTTNPIESTFATVKHRTRQSRGCFSRETIVGASFKLLLEAEKRWKKLYGYKQLADVVNLVKFIDGVDFRTIDKMKGAA
jgi:putative transposase